MSDKFERIAKRVAIANDTDVVKQVIDGENVDEKSAMDSIQSIIDSDGSPDAKKLLKEITGSAKDVKTAGSYDAIIDKIKNVSHGSSRVLMALLAAAMLAGTVPARAAEKVMDEYDGVKTEAVKENNYSALERIFGDKQPSEALLDYLYDGMSKSSCNEVTDAERVTHDNYVARGQVPYERYWATEVAKLRYKKMTNIILGIDRYAKKNPSDSLDKAFQYIRRRGETDLTKRQLETLDKLYKEFQSSKGIDATQVPCHIPKTV